LKEICCKNWEKVSLQAYSLSNKKLFLLALFLLFIILIFDFIFSIFLYEDITGYSNQITHPRIITHFIGPVLIAPFFETLIFQVLFFKAGVRLSIPVFYILIVSSVLFSLCHRLNIFDLFFYFLRGVTIFYYYYLLIKKREKAFWYSFLLHSCYNFLIIFPYWVVIYMEEMCNI